MTALVVALFTASFFAEAAALSLVARNAKHAVEVLRGYRERDRPEGGVTFGHFDYLVGVIDELVRDVRSPILAASLIAVGLLLGTVANFISLTL